MKSESKPAVAIITRTKDRVIMLERAAKSVAAQKLQDFVWVVVNDGGEPTAVDKVVENAGIKNFKVIHHAKNKGMEAASNSGIESVDSEFLVIHDDDDTWHPDFLLATVEFLRSERGLAFGGVITESVQIDEKIVGNEIHELKTQKWNPVLSYYPQGAVHLSDIAVINQFPPIAFVYRRDALQVVGSYDESLPVLGDWDFNLRFLREFDISVLPLAFANYHHRPSITASNAHYGNSVHAGFDRHSTYEALVRNKHLRQGLNGADPVFATMLSAGRQALVERMKNSSSNRLSDAVFHRLVRVYKFVRNLVRR